MNRKISPQTLKILFALSRNQCAHPECTTTVIESATEHSDALVIAQICHIYAINKNGPRGKSGLTQKELNSPGNLILLCPNHHRLVDGQYETHTADMLKQWKYEHETKVKKQLNSKIIQPDVSRLSYFPTAIIDQRIKDEIDNLRKSRFFVGFDRTGVSLALGKRLVDKELSGGTDAIRSWALAWCVRLLSIEELDKAEEYLDFVRNLESCTEIDIADAFISSQKGDKSAALNMLANIGSPASRSAALMIVAHHETAERAVDWLNTAGISATDLDPDGRCFLLAKSLELGRWANTKEILAILSEQDFEGAPALHHMVAMTHLLTTVPEEFRAIVRNQLPFEVARFPLTSDSVALDTRRIAHRHFISASEAARRLNCPNAATVDGEYALWLELRDPENSDQGRRQLEAKLSNPEPTLRLVHLGLQFGINLDLVAVEQEIERQIALHGEMTPDTAIARFALALTQETPRGVAEYITHHYDELSKHLYKKALRFYQIEMFSQAGLPEKANEYLDLLLRDGLSESEENRLRIIISTATGTNPVELQKTQFRKTDSLQDLSSLVTELESKKEWHSLCEYGKILFQRTRTVHDAECLATALSNAHKTGQLVELLEENTDILAQSRHLQMLYSSALYHEGALLEARSELGKLNDDSDNQNYRALRVNLEIALGNWNALSAFVDNEYQQRNNRSAQELIRSAHLALRINSPHARDLLFFAADKGNDVADVLAAAYFLATNAGWEEEGEVIHWLQKAIELSGNDGPIQTVSLQDVVDRNPEWNHRASKIWNQLFHGDIPISLAAQFLNKPLIELMIFPALVNPSKNDLRYKAAIPAFSGTRHPIQCTTGRAIGIDLPALYTLSLLNLLDKVLDSFDTVYLPHSTLGWLFKEKEKVEFHQPTKIKDAHQVRNLLVTGNLKKFIPTTIVDSDLSDQIGDELSALITEAQKTREKNDTQNIVVRPYPVHQVGSLMEKEADLTEHAAVMSSCLAIVENLRENGQITANEERKACAYLKFHEKPWPHQPRINDQATLYLDDLAVNYFLHLGILEKLHTAGFRAFISPTKISEIDEFIAYEGTSVRAEEIIEGIRSAVNSRIESGKIKIGKQLDLDKKEQFYANPIEELFTLIDDCDVIISDERCINQYGDIDGDIKKTPTLSTLDLLDRLTSIESITLEDKFEYRTQLRRAGYFFVPVNDDELTNYLDASTVKDGKVIETAELKAIRENILHVRMNDWLQLPKELYWLEETIKVFIRILKNLWKDGADVPNIKALSDWIIDQIDIRGWVHRFEVTNQDSAVAGRGVQILMLLRPPSGISQDLKEEYWNWIEDRILIPVREQYPDLYAWIIEQQRKEISAIVDMDLTEEE